MSKSKKKNEQMYTLPIDYTIEVVTGAEEQVERATELLNLFYHDNLFNEGKKGLIPILIEIMWTNYAIMKIFAAELEDSVVHHNEDTNVEEYVLLEETIYTLQNLLLARHYAGLELTRLSFSISLH